VQAQLDIPAIPAMTSDAERECYYRLVRQGVGEGEIVELGAWLGASTAYIATAIRDSGSTRKAHVYDKFQAKQPHLAKVDEFYAKRGIEQETMQLGSSFDRFKANMGPLLEYVEPHPGQIEDIEWGNDRIAVLISDAPKRVPAISAVLTRLRDGIQPGTVMAWQDFGHFPSYEIPACFYRLRDHVEFVEAVVPGSTLVFRVKSQWDASEVSRAALSLNRWSPDEIVKAWDYWLGFVPEEKAALFRCGRAMFLCDIGQYDDAVEALAEVDEDPAVVSKWQYLWRARDAFQARYKPLFGHLAERGAL
jgi:hypothetical protein